METFNNFISTNRGLIRKHTAYYGLSKDDIYQECALAYYSETAIESLFLEGKNYRAVAIFIRILDNQMKSWSDTGSIVDRYNAYLRQKNMRNSAFGELVLNDTYCIDDEIENKIILRDLINNGYGDDISWLIEYYEMPRLFMTKKYGISDSTLRKQAQRKRDKLKEFFLSRNNP